MLNVTPRLPVAAALLAAALGASRGVAADCNGNGVDDFEEVLGGQETDCNGNRVPDTCDILRVNHGLSFLGKLASQPVGESNAALSFLAEDLDQDGAADLAVLLPGNVMSILWGDGRGQFSPTSQFRGEAALALVAGNVNRDGRVDLVVGSQLGVAILLQSTRRSFSAGPIHRAASTSGALALADLDADGDLDVAFAGSFEFFIFRGAGDGTFAEPEVTPAGSGPILIALGDIDGDGHIDVATANALPGVTTGSLSVFLNRGGTFSAPRNYAVGQAPSAITTGDLNGDGRADLVVTNSGSADVSVFHAGEDGKLTARPRLATGGSPLSATIADLDLDGDGDLAVARAWDAREPGAGSAVTLFWNHAGDVIGAFELRTDGRPVSMVARDLFGGEALEVALLDGLSGEVHLLGDDFIAYSPDCNGNLVPDECDLAHEDCNGNGHDDTCDVVEGRASDCNGNGLPDECEPDCNRNASPDDCDVSSRRSADCNLNGAPDDCDLSRGSFSFEVSSTGAALLSMAARDLDGDGFLDLVGLDLGERLVVSWNEEGELEPPASVAPEGAGSSFAAVDLDGDRDVDLVEGERGSRKVRILVQSGRREFSPGPEIALDEPPESLAAADLDGGGLAEIAALDAAGDIVILESTGDGALHPVLTLAAGAAPGFLAVADIDVDGARDLACILRDGAPAVLWNGGGATFAGPAPLPATRPVHAPVIGDIDRDGDVDLAAAEGDDVVLFVQIGPRIFERRSPFQTKDIAALAVADADLDGLNDLVVAHRGRVLAGIEVRRAAGVGVFGEPHPLSAPAGLEGIAIADVDRSGTPDILASFQDAPCPQCPLVGRIFTWRNLTVPPASIDADQNGRPDECDRGAFHRGDADGDGALSLSDAVFTLRALFQGGPAAGCAEAADADNDGSLSVTDAVSVLEFLFRGGPPPASPGPPPAPCGLDADLQGSAGDLGCASYVSC